MRHALTLPPRAPAIVLAATAPPLAWAAAQLLGLRLAPASAWQALWLLALAPALEELVFRQWLQQGLAQQLRTHARFARAGLDGAGLAATALAALAFAIAHVPQAGAMAVWWLLPGLALGELWRRHQRLCPCVALHAWFNLCLVAASHAAAR